jgi:hypothetical protein
MCDKKVAAEWRGSYHSIVKDLFLLLFSWAFCFLFMVFFLERETIFFHFFHALSTRCKYDPRTYIYPHPLLLPIFGNLKNQRIESLFPWESTLKKADTTRPRWPHARRRIPNDSEWCQHSDRASEEHGSWPIEPVTGSRRKNPTHPGNRRLFLFLFLFSF